MPTCPNCGSIVMEGDPYCSHCGAHFKWSGLDDDIGDYISESQSYLGEPDSFYASQTDYGGPSSYDSYVPGTDDGKQGGFLDFGEVSKTYIEAGEEELEYIAGMICADSSQKLQLKAQIREYQKAKDFNGFYIKKDYGFEVYYFHFIQENEYVKTTHVMTYRQDEFSTYNPYETFYDSYSEHNHDRLIANPRFKRLVEGVGLEFDGCGGGYETNLESVGDVELTGDISIRVYFKADGKKRVYDLDLDEMKLCFAYEYDPNKYF